MNSPNREQKLRMLENSMSDRITNPATGRKILVKSALSYPKDSDAYKAAIAHLKKNNKGGGSKSSKRVKPEVADKYGMGADDVVGFAKTTDRLLTSDSKVKHLRSARNLMDKRADEYRAAMVGPFRKHGLDVDWSGPRDMFEGDVARLSKKDPEAAKKAMQAYESAAALSSMAHKIGDRLRDIGSW